jgi:hypothetical protein
MRRNTLPLLRLTLYASLERDHDYINQTKIRR